MGCCGSAYLDINPEEAESYIRALREQHGGNVLVVIVKDQNHPGKLCLTGPAEPAMLDAIESTLKADAQNTSVERKKDKYDTMFDVVWHNTVITTGHQMLSFTKSYFPRGKLFVSLLDTISSHGWTLAAAPNFGGVESRDKDGNVTSCVDWPVFIYYKDTPQTQSRYSNEHLFWGVKDSNVPGKLCCSGPIGGLEAEIAKVFNSLGQNEVVSEKDKYDDDFDVVWRNTSLTTGLQALSFGKKYFPKGIVWASLLECATRAGWRVMACPNFGGQGDSWPGVIFRKLKSTADMPPPATVFASIKDSNLPGKLCLSGPGVPAVQAAVLAALQAVADNGDVKFDKDRYDDDHDVVIHNVKITTGMAAFSLKLPYFPRCDSMMALLGEMQKQGYSLVGCPNFGGMLDSWPTFIWQADPNPTQPMYLAVKDDNIPGKLNLGGGGIEGNTALAGQLLAALQKYNGPAVAQAKDDYDETFGICYRNTTITTGHTAFSLAKPYFPHGYVLEAILVILRGHGWEATGGPNFGDDGNTWPSIVFQHV